MERRFKINVDGRDYNVTIEEVTEGGALIMPEPGSMNVPMTPAEAAPVPSTGPSASPGDEVTPLAGVVHSVDVKVGDEVEEGKQIASVEAMKMVTKIMAHRSGKVAEIFVNVGDGVEAGQPILCIE